MWHKANVFLARNKGAAWATGTALLAGIAWADHLTKVEYGFGLFYLLPIAILAWHAGLWPGLLMSAASGGAWFAMDYLEYLDHGEAFAKFSLIAWNAGMALGIFIIVTLAMARLKRALEHEREAARLKTEMLALVSHEFNNSLTSMGMALLLLRQHDEHPEPRRRVYPVLDRIHRVLKQTVSNFLDQARMQSGRFRLDIRQIELRKMVEDTAALLRPLSDQKEISLSLEFPETDFPVNADQDALALVMSNLIGNAIKYTPNRGRVTVRLKPLGEPAAEVEVSVEDTGIGIGPEDQEAIFQGFYRTAEGKREARGYGVGLKVAREIVASHESVLKVESAPGKGSRFHFTLPVCPPDCPHRGAGLCHRCRRRNPLALQELYDGGIPPAGADMPSF